MPPHIFVRLSCDLLHRRKAEVLKKAFARSEKSPVRVLPEIHTLRIQNHVFPEQLIGDPDALLPRYGITHRRRDPYDIGLIQSDLERDMQRFFEIGSLHRDDQMEEPLIFA